MKTLKSQASRSDCECLAQKDSVPALNTPPPPTYHYWHRRRFDCMKLGSVLAMLARTGRQQSDCMTTCIPRPCRSFRGTSYYKMFDVSSEVRGIWEHLTTYMT